MCIYGMEGPGGYQFVGRTLQVWNTYRQTREFEPGSPWLLRFFDQIRFYPVEADELLRMRADFLQGKVALSIERETFRFGAYRRMLEQNAEPIAAFKRTQSAAFLEERERWAAQGQDVVSAVSPEPERRALPLSDLAPGLRAITSPVAGNLWKVLVEPGQRVQNGAVIAIVEAMKTEIAVHAASGGKVHELCAVPGASVMPGDRLAVIAQD